MERTYYNNVINILLYDIIVNHSCLDGHMSDISYSVDIDDQKFDLFGYIENNHKTDKITWESIAEVLDKMDHRDLSQEIRHKYCKPRDSST